MNYLCNLNKFFVISNIRTYIFKKFVQALEIILLPSSNLENTFTTIDIKKIFLNIVKY